MKTKRRLSQAERKLLDELIYQRTMARNEMRSAKAGFARCKEIAMQMRELRRVKNENPV